MSDSSHSPRLPKSKLEAFSYSLTLEQGEEEVSERNLTLIEEMEIARLINLYPILQELPPLQQHSLYDSGYTLRFRAGEVIYAADRPLQFFFFMTSGSIRVIRLGQDREILLYRWQPGEICILSTCHLLAGLPYQARASTEGPVTGVAVPEATFAGFVESSPAFCMYLFHTFSERVINLLTLLEAVSFSRLGQRLAVLLLSKGIIIEATHSELADELGCVREVISRILKNFERKGLVKLGRGWIRILDRPALERIATYFSDQIQ